MSLVWELFRELSGTYRHIFIYDENNYITIELSFSVTLEVIIFKEDINIV